MARATDARRDVLTREAAIRARRHAAALPSTGPERTLAISGRRASPAVPPAALQEMIVSIVLALALVLQPPPQPATVAPVPDQWKWGIGGMPATAYAVADTAGRVTDTAGASATLRLTSRMLHFPGAYGSYNTGVPATAARGRRVRLAGEFRTTGTARASLYLRVDQGGQRLILDNGTDNLVVGAFDWTAREVVLPVPPTADRIGLGILLLDGDAMSVRHLRFEILPPLPPTTPLAPAARVQLDSAIALAHEYSVWRDTVTWRTVEPEARALAAGASSVRDVAPAIRLLLSRLGDHHSRLIGPQTAAIQQAGLVENPLPTVRVLGVDEPLEARPNARLNVSPALPRRRAGIPGGNGPRVGVIWVPGYTGGQPDSLRAYAGRMHEVLLGAVPQVACGWVLDLRDNAGGNRAPMLEGLRPFLGTDTLGTFEGPPKTFRTPWTAATLGVTPPDALAPLAQAPVAVLTGSETGSSGEIVALSFRGRPRTRSFGHPTAGLASANVAFPLPDGSALVLTTAIDRDRTGQRFAGPVPPDEVVPVPLGDAAGPDPELDRAREWVAAAAGCRRGP